jgi:hypothetical protein
MLARIGHDWAVRCFGAEHVANGPERALRLLEEAIELAQAFHVPADKARECVDMVYARPVGEREQEAGGVLHTMGILAEVQGWDLIALHEREVRRVLQKPPKLYADRNREKYELGMKLNARPTFEHFIRPSPDGKSVYLINGIEVDREQYVREAIKWGVLV